MLQRSTIETPQAVLDAYYEDLKQQHLSPLWTQPGGAAAPTSKHGPFRWRWQDLRREAMRALELVGTAQAERRVICCVNPAAGRGARRECEFQSGGSCLRSGRSRAAGPRKRRQRQTG